MDTSIYSNIQSYIWHILLIDSGEHCLGN